MSVQVAFCRVLVRGRQKEREFLETRGTALSRGQSTGWLLNLRAFHDWQTRRSGVSRPWPRSARRCAETTPNAAAIDLHSASCPRRKVSLAVFFANSRKQRTSHAEDWQTARRGRRSCEVWSEVRGPPIRRSAGRRIFCCSSCLCAPHEKRRRSRREAPGSALLTQPPLSATRLHSLGGQLQLQRL